MPPSQISGMGRRVLGPGKAALSPAIKARTAVANISPSASTISLNSTFSESTFAGENAGVMMGSSPTGSGAVNGGGPLVCPICSEQMVSC